MKFRSPRAFGVSSVERLSKGGSGQGMSFWVYILRCADHSYYTGHTDNLETRIMQHQTGEIEGFTSTRLPATLVFADEFTTREEALSRERQVKGWSRKKKEAMMRGDWAEVSRLARGKRPSTGSGRTGKRESPPEGAKN